MAAGQGGDRFAAVQALEPPASVEPAIRAEFREGPERVRRLAPECSHDRGTASRARTYDVDVRAFPRYRPEPWPPSVKFAVECAILAALLAALIYGPPYYQCRQAKARGMFFVGDTVEACFRDRLKAQDTTLGAFVQGLREGF